MVYLFKNLDYFSFLLKLPFEKPYFSGLGSILMKSLQLGIQRAPGNIRLGKINVNQDVASWTHGG